MKKLQYFVILSILAFAAFGMFSFATQVNSIVRGSPALAAPPAATATAEMVVPTPRAAADLEGGLFVSITTDNIDRAAMAVGFATKVLQGTEKPVTIFLNVEGVRLVDVNIPQNVHKSEMTIGQMLDKFMAEGGVVLVCPVCMKNVGGLATDEIREGVIIGTPEYTWSAMFADNVTVLSY
jgi:predicted peroxiredoxin